MYSNILVPVLIDNNPSTKKAIDIAKQMLSDDGTITLLHVVEETPTYVNQMIPSDVIVNTIKNSQSEIKKMAETHAPGAKTAVVRGHASRSIMDYRDENDCDCIVIASHQPGLEDYFLGSTAARVVRHAQCSVHVLR